MTDCCDDKKSEIDLIREKHGRVLWVVLIINAIMFFIEAIGGILAQSTSLLADSLDMFGDTLIYGFSLFVLTRSMRWQAGGALLKGIFMLVIGLVVLADATYKMFVSVMPDIKIMGVIGLLALVANLVCFLLLYKHRDDNLNMSSTWLCSRNDLFANTGVLIAAGSSYLLLSKWPDIIVGIMIVLLFLYSAFHVIGQSLRAFRKN